MILITSDFLAERHNTIGYHFNGICSLLEKTIARATFEKILNFSLSQQSKDLQFDPVSFFALSGLKYKGELPPILDCSRISDDSLNYAKEFLSNFSLIVGYELTRPTIKLLEILGIKYINIWLHPIRYLDDELFYVTSSDAKFKDILKSIEVNEDSYFIGAEYARVLINRRHRLNIPESSIVFFGQTSNDKTLRKNEGYFCVSDFADAISSMASRANKFIYAQHPLRKDKSEREALKYIVGDKLLEVQANGYQLLSNENVELVSSISSSIALEGYFFNKNVVLLRGPTVDILSGSGVSVGSSIFNPNIWRSFFGERNSEGEFFWGKKNKIRNILDCYYAYPILRDHYDQK